MKYWIAILGFVLFFSACSNKPKKGEFTQEELSWLVYNVNDVVVFADSTGKKKESLKVVFRTELNQIKQYYPIEAEMSLSDIDSSKSFRIYLLKDQNGFKKYLRMGEVYRSLDIVKPIAELQIGSKTYKDVFVITEDTTKQKLHIWKTWYNKEKGVLQFATTENELLRIVEQ